MAKARVKLNKFGDVIVEVDEPGTLASFLASSYVPDKVTIIKSPSLVSLNSSNLNWRDFKFLVSLNGVDIFANEVAREKCPPIIDGCLRGVVVALIVTVESEDYAVLVKDRTKEFLTNPAGFRASSDEKPQETAVREVLEETGLQISEVTPCGRSTRKYFAYDIQFMNETDIFYSRINIPKKEMERVLEHQDHEIEEVVFVPLEKVRHVESCTGVKAPVMEHHLLILEFITAKIRDQEVEWKSRIPSYMISLELY